MHLSFERARMRGLRRSKSCPNARRARSEAHRAQCASPIAPDAS
ncbi:Uncharacterized protein pbN1_38480 [Aromatoleum bremense]|nr:Uncharacterized protein pbN1_38480 [Aromatoleum bremense]